jgi:hypothetical protein
VSSRLRQVALVAAHFPPSNLASVHRARLLAQHLREFGWEPIIVTTHWKYYEENLDWELCELLDPNLKIIRTRAISTKPVRVVGDIGIRAFPWHCAAIRNLILQNEIDFVHITIPSFYSALLGQCIYSNRRIPFGIDYIDPWVHIWPEAEQRLSKAWISMKLSRILEPCAVRHASLITGVAEGYYAGVLQRNPSLSVSAVTAAMPYGNSTRDFEIVTRKARKPRLFDPEDGRFHFVYAGAMLPKAYLVLDSLFAALGIIKTDQSNIFSRLRFHFIGTGKSPSDPEGYNIFPRSEQVGVSEIITEHPQRMGYVDTLTHLAKASAILILGSTEPHYSPSKIYQSVDARRPIFALLHGSSSAVAVLRESNSGFVVTLNEMQLPEPTVLAVQLVAFVVNNDYNAEKVDWLRFGAYSAKESARKFAVALDNASERFAKR